MNLLGLNAYHADAAACLVVDGRLVAAVEEERFRRVKHWAGFPAEAARWCLAREGVALEDVNVVAVNRDPRANLWRKGLYTLRTRPDPGLVLDRLRNLGKVSTVADELEAVLGGRFRGDVHPVEHHRAHQASSFLASPFREAALLSVDGFGDFASASWGVGRGTEIELDGRIYFPHSLGTFYLTMTQYLGFPRYGDEYKVMGMAPYGEPTYLPELRRVVDVRPDGEYRLALEFFRHQDTDLDYRWDDGEPTVEDHYTPALKELLGPARRPDEELTDRHRDLARSTQEIFEEAVFALLRRLHEEHPLDAVALSGGAAMNSVANGKVRARTAFEEVWIPPAPGDAGGAVGAALAAWHDRAGTGREPAMVHSRYGPGYSDDDCGRALEERSEELEAAGCTERRYRGDEALCEAVAEEIADGRVVGWFQGRMEFGPRALGARSILCDPRRADMRDIINARVKLRESFRPFAPSVLREHMADWFEADDDVPFMMKVYPIRPERREEIPAVTHVDGTGRPQTVTREQNPLYYRLISAFHRRTGVPLVLNTSFNENEPIVNRPEEALDCFLRTDMDVLVLGERVVRKRETEAADGRRRGGTGDTNVR